MHKRWMDELGEKITLKICFISSDYPDFLSLSSSSLSSSFPIIKEEQ